MAENFRQDDSIADDRSSFDYSGIVPTQISSRIRWGAIVVTLIVLFLLLSFLRSIYTAVSYTHLTLPTILLV